MSCDSCKHKNICIVYNELNKFYQLVVLVTWKPETVDEIKRVISQDCKNRSLK